LLLSPCFCFIAFGLLASLAEGVFAPLLRKPSAIKSRRLASLLAKQSFAGGDEASVAKKQSKQRRLLSPSLHA
jgi:hypothetical protein